MKKRIAVIMMALAMGIASCACSKAEETKKKDKKDKEKETTEEPEEEEEEEEESTTTEEETTTTTTEEETTTTTEEETDVSSDVSASTDFSMPDFGVDPTKYNNAGVADLVDLLTQEDYLLMDINMEGNEAEIPEGTNGFVGMTFSEQATSLLVYLELPDEESLQKLLDDEDGLIANLSGTDFEVREDGNFVYFEGGNETEGYLWGYADRETYQVFLYEEIGTDNAEKGKEYAALVGYKG